MLLSELHIATSSEKDDALRQNEALKEELNLLKSQSEAAIKKSNDDAQKQVEEAQAGLMTRGRSLVFTLLCKPKNY